MKSKTHSLAAQNEILIETQLQNATAKTLYLESVHFAPSPQFECEPLTHFEPKGLGPPRLDGATSAPDDGTTSALPAFGLMAYLKAGDTQQYMYRLRGLQPSAKLRQVSALGRMEARATTTTRRTPPAN